MKPHIGPGGGWVDKQGYFGEPTLMEERGWQQVGVEEKTMNCNQDPKN